MIVPLNDRLSKHFSVVCFINFDAVWQDDLWIILRFRRRSESKVDDIVVDLFGSWKLIRIAGMIGPTFGNYSINR